MTTALSQDMTAEQINNFEVDMTKFKYKSIRFRDYQADIIKELAYRANTSIVDIMDDVLWHGWKGLGQNVKEIERSR